MSEPTGRGPARVRVTNPRVTARRSLPPPPPTRDIDELTDVGEVYMRSLIRTQARIGFGVLACVVAVLAGLPLLFELRPALASGRLLGLPVAFLLLGVAAYPVLLAAAHWAVRGAERAERDFADLLRRRVG